MRKLLNTLYVTSPDGYLSLDEENVVIYDSNTELGRIPLHNLEGTASSGYRGVSPALIGGRVERDISLCVLSPQGRFLARMTGRVRGNVLLRRKQYQVSMNQDASLVIAKNCILGRVYDAKWVLERAVRDHGLQIDTEKVKNAAGFLKQSLRCIEESRDVAQLRGHEREDTSVYFGVFDQLILQQKKDFYFKGRSRRPPLDNVSAMLPFVYTLLANTVASALETIGLGPYMGFIHTNRSGRLSLTLDLMEELRPVLADRFVLTLTNRKMVNKRDFSRKRDGAVIIGDEARKLLLSEWQSKKKEVITHPYLNEKVEWGMIPSVQAMLLSRYLRGDVDEYPPFFWRQKIPGRWAGGGGYTLVLITCDMNMETAAGRARLREVARQRVDHGTRIQNSIFECILDNAQLVKLKAILTDIIDRQADNPRFYNLGNKHTTKVDHVGMSKGINVEKSLVFQPGRGR